MEKVLAIDFLLLDVLANVRNGVGVNELYRMLRGRISKVSLIREVRKLYSLGLVKISKSPKHKQKILIFADEKVVEVFEKVRFGSNGMMKDFLSFSDRLKNCISSYYSYISTITNPLIRSYATYRIIKQFSDFIKNSLGVSDEFDV